MLLLIQFTSLDAQNERSHWYFGDLAGMKYDNGAYVNLSDNTIIRNIAFGIIEGPKNIICANDEEGNLMFYSDGRVFKNRQHQNLLNSPTDKYAFRGSQAAIARDPSDPNRYYVFVTIQEGLKTKLTYSIVDMSLDNGLGGLVPDKKHVVMLTNVGQHLVVARHANGRDSWLICLSRGTYRAYLITENGISSSAITSNEGVTFFDGNAANYGMMEISPDNKLIAAGFPTLRKLFVLKFNDLNGKLELVYEEEEENQDPGIGPFASVEFSSNSKVLYTTYLTSGIQQYDLSDLENIPPFVRIAGISSNYPYLKRGPDGKIFSITRGAPYMDAIQEPNIIGTDCNYSTNVLTLSGTNLVDLPTFLQPKFPDGISYINICQGETTELNFSVPYIETINEWDLGDGNKATGEHIEHTYEHPGTYTVTVDVYSNFTNNVVYTDSTEITIYASPAIDELDNIYQCTQDDTIIFIEKDPDILGDLDPEIFMVSYFNSEINALLKDDEITEYSPEIGTKTIWARVENKINPSCYDIREFDIITPEYISLDIATEQYLCPKIGLTLNAPDGFLSYEWSTGETTQNIEIDFTGKYDLTVVKDLGEYTCEIKTTISVSDPAVTPDIKDIKVIDWSINQNSIEIIMANQGDFEYSIDGINYQESPQFLNLPIDNYEVFVRDIYCSQQIKSDTIYLLGYNPFFTPNGDGYNDYWQIINADRDLELEVVIMDRFGKILAILDSKDKGWDGMHNGQPLPSSDYWFKAELSNGEVQTGHFTLKR